MLAKSGADVLETLQLVEYILTKCQRLQYYYHIEFIYHACSFCGIMTIGKEGDLKAFQV